MAKFGRYDPRNSKKDRNKRNAQNKDLKRIRDVSESKYPDKMLREIAYDNEYDYEPPKQLNS